MCPLTISNMNISKIRGPIATKVYLKHHWDGGKPVLGFGPDRIRTLVSIATDSSHRVIMGKTASQVTMTYIRAWMSSKFGQIRPQTTELAALERQKKIPIDL